MKLKNGSYLFLDFVHFTFGAGNPKIIVDVNGSGGPNISGKDVFTLYVNKKGVLYMPGYDRTREQILAACKRYPGYGEYYENCQSLIQYDGWEIKDDYPW